MNRVRVGERVGKAGRLAAAVRRALLRSMRLMRLKDTEVSLLLTSDPEMARLNRKYRNVNRPTDVLSFSQDEPARKGGHLLLGDIVISISTARRQAKAAGHSLHTECATLAVHGLLHLLGHDHEDRGETKKMFFLQDQILKKVSRHV